MLGHAAGDEAQTRGVLVRDRGVLDGQLRSLANHEHVVLAVFGVHAFCLGKQQAAADHMAVEVDGELLAVGDHERGLTVVCPVVFGKRYDVAVVGRVYLLLQERPAALHGSLAVCVRYDLERWVGRVEVRVGEHTGVVVLETRGERAEAAIVKVYAHAGTLCERTDDL